jgi:hypothetical protein
VAGAVGGVAGLQLVGLMSSQLGLGASLAIVAVPALFGALLLWLLPETGGEALSD